MRFCGLKFLFNTDFRTLVLRQFDMDSWRPRHGPAQVRASLDPIIKHLRDSGVTQIGATVECNSPCDSLQVTDMSPLSKNLFSFFPNRGIALGAPSLLYQMGYLNTSLAEVDTLRPLRQKT